jgi:hypothetical protein
MTDKPQEGEYIAADINQETAMVALNVTQAALDALADKYSVCPDASTSEGMVEIKAGLKELVGFRTKVEDRRKTLKAPLLERGRVLDAAAKDVIGQIKDIEEPMAVAKKRVDDAKKKADDEHKARLQAQMDVLRNMPMQLVNASSEQIGKALEEVEDFDHNNFYWFKEEAAQLKADTRNKLGEMLAAAITREQEAERQRVEQERLDREREELQRQQAEQRQREQEAEAKRQAEEEQRRKEQDELHSMRADAKIKEFHTIRDESVEDQTLAGREHALAALKHLTPSSESHKIFGEHTQRVMHEYAECKQVVLLAIETLKAKDEIQQETVESNTADIGATPGPDEEVLATTEPNNLTQGILPIMEELAECYAKHGISLEASTDINEIVARYI